MSASLHEMVAWLDQEFQTGLIPDYPGAVNGLQLENDGKVPRVIAAVDASLPVMEKVAEGGAGLLIVHHGMFWQGTQVLTGPFYRKVKAAIEAGVAVYSSHLPLDVHRGFGNNVLLAGKIGIQNLQPFLDWKGIQLGVRGFWDDSRDALGAAIGLAVGGQVHVCAGGPVRPRHIGLITGGAGSEVAKAAACGVDTFITGEGPHWSYPLAEELGVNLFYAGHYATETFGVRRVAEELASRFGIPWSFVDHPSGL